MILEKFWPDVYARAGDLAAPPASLFNELAARLSGPDDPAEVAKCIELSLQQTTDNTDTHPCLRERLQALGRRPEDLDLDHLAALLPPRSGPSAAEVFLGAKLAEWMEKLGQEWSKQVEKSWAQRHQEVQELKLGLARAEAAAAGENTVAVLWCRARLLMDQQDAAGALATAAEILQRQPDHPGANIFQGQYLLARGDAAGIPHLERAVQADDTMTLGVLNLQHHYYQKLGDTEKLLELDHRYQEYKLAVALAEAERGALESTDVFTPHDLSPAELAETISLLAAKPDICTASLVRKTVVHRPQQACFVLYLNTGHEPAEPAARNLVNQLAEQIKLPGTTNVFLADAGNAAAGKAILAVPGSTIYHHNP